MHANVNQVTEGKVLDEQVKIRIFEASRQSCFLFDETSGQCAYMGLVRKCDGKCRLISRIWTSCLVEKELQLLVEPYRQVQNSG
ncbi:hypothetical protein [Phocaeicola vulgatus]|uniref:hypothetical protein n=1 Tax=Phocaeicola vulgatus TaxID=821 RepID=UPI0039B3EF2F